MSVTFSPVTLSPWARLPNYLPNAVVYNSLVSCSLESFDYLVMISPVVGCITGEHYCLRFKYLSNVCFILLGVNAEGQCVIMSNATDCRASCVIISGIWNYVLVFCVGAGTTW